jgi:formylglycine-generating enzyme required for sulfatase activity
LEAAFPNKQIYNKQFLSWLGWLLFYDEGPQHTVSIKAPFAVGRFAVTFNEWDA